MQPKISVIIPVWNLETVLERCLNSVLKQTYTNLEIIVVNDGSTDRSKHILNDYAERHENIVVVHQENAGVTAARLNGVSKASGEWIGFVDGDDYIEPEMYQILLENALKYQTEISHCGYQLVFADGRIHYFHNSEKLNEYDCLEGLEALLEGITIEPGLCNKLYHRSLFDELLSSDKIDLSIKNNEDLLLNVLLFKAAKKSVFYDICPYHYIVRANSASRRKLDEHRIFDPIRVRCYIKDLIPGTIMVTAQKAYINCCLDVLNTILLEGKRDYMVEYNEVFQLLSAEKQGYRLLGKRRMFMAILATSIPFLYEWMYRFYVSHCKKDVYK